MPRVGVQTRPVHPRTINCLRPGTPFVLPPSPWYAACGASPAHGTFVEVLGCDAKVLVGDRVVYWSSATVVLPTGAPGTVPAAASNPVTRPSGPSRAERREQLAIVEHAVARERSAPRQPVPVVQQMLGEEC